MYRTDFWTLWEKARVGCFRRIESKHVYYLGWNRSPAQVGCMRQVLGPGALGRPRGIGWRGRWEGGSGWGIHVYPWLIHVYVWQNPLQYCKVISLQLIKKKQSRLQRALRKPAHMGHSVPIVALRTVWKATLLSLTSSLARGPMSHVRSVSYLRAGGRRKADTGQVSSRKATCLAWIRCWLGTTASKGVSYLGW